MTLLAQLSAADPDYDPEDLPVEAARRLVLKAVSPLAGRETIALREALGRIAPEAIRSPIDVPPANNSALDGFALRGTDLVRDGETVLREVATALAGHPYHGRIQPGECVRIMTGALMPADADTVVARELTRVADGRVTLSPGAKPGQNWRRAGEDLAAGHVAVPAGTRLAAAELGLLASLGIAEVAVAPRVRVALLSTGDELCEIGEPLGEGQLYDSNRYTLHALLTRLGCLVEDFGVIRDDPALLRERLEAAISRSDVVVASGGISVGDADFTGTLMASLGEVLAWKLAMRPGRPLVFGHLQKGPQPAWLFGLPGNPVAAMISFIQFVRPALLKLGGATEFSLPTIPARITADIRKKPGRAEFPRGIVTFAKDGPQVAPFNKQGSGILSSMSRANGLIVLEHGRGDVAAGEFVPVQMLSGLV
jgi:molybdopterin molybdotransferase